MSRSFRARIACMHAFAALSLAAAPFAIEAHAATRPSNAEILFRMSNPCPGGAGPQAQCKGYVVDRVIPLACGGADDASNMRWITLAEAKEKARWEKIGCRRGRKLVLPGQEASVTEAFALGESAGPVRPLPLGSRPPEALPPSPPATANDVESAAPESGVPSETPQ